MYDIILNLYPELSVLTLSPISVNAYMPRIFAKNPLNKGNLILTGYNDPIYCKICKEYHITNI
jgi:hypothetical protein